MSVKSTRTFVETVDGGSRALQATDFAVARTATDGVLNSAVFTADISKAAAQEDNLKCTLQVDVVRPLVPTYDDRNANARLAELVRCVAAEEEKNNATTTSNVKSVYVRVEFNSVY